MPGASQVAFHGESRADNHHYWTDFASSIGLQTVASLNSWMTRGPEVDLQIHKTTAPAELK